MSEDTMKRYTIRLPNEVAAGAALLAEVEGVSINQMVLDCLVQKIAHTRESPETKAKVVRQIEMLKEQYGLR